MDIHVRAAAQPEKPITAWIRALDRVSPFARGEGATLPAILADMATRIGTRPALLMESGSLSYYDLAERVARYARWTLLQGIGQGDVVCLLLPNCPDYAAIWLGITSVRGVVALLNPNLAGDALLHAIVTARPKHLIVSAGIQDKLTEIRCQLSPDIAIWSVGAGTGWPRIDAYVQELTDLWVGVQEQRPARINDLALQIFTSGTTGLPKAARVSHRRIAEWSCWFAGLLDTTQNDTMYNCLPMYHSVGGVVAIGAMLVAGGSVVIRPKFSATRFWDEVVKWDCTLFQYIGELCRYLVNSPRHPKEAAHQLRLCCGNGLRGDVWEKFQRRFRIPRILEFYASTEGNVSLYNCAGLPGAIGNVPAFLAHRFPVVLVRCYLDTGTLLRDESGLCIQCTKGQVGEALGRISTARLSPGRPFEGYTDEAASEAKIARDVVIKGDAWFRTGDLMRCDADGFFYFVDRLGDTFRWKGENVATQEVAAVLRSCPGVLDAAVYGVTVPGTEGKAGMAALTVEPEFQLNTFRSRVELSLPEYARPVFLRLCRHIAATSTFKPAIALLAREGYDPHCVTDPLYVDDRAGRSFLPLDCERYAALERGELRL